MTVSTPFGYGELSNDHTVDNTSNNKQNDESNYTYVNFPWGQGSFVSNYIETSPEFHFITYSDNNTKRTFGLKISLSTIGSDVISFIQKHLKIPDDFSISLLQSNGYEIKKITKDTITPFYLCTFPPALKHPIFIEKTQYVQFDPNRCSVHVLLRDKNCTAMQFAKGVGSIFGTFDMADIGSWYWEVQLHQAREGDGVFVGVAATNMPVNGNMLSRGLFWGLSCATGHKFHDTFEYYTKAFVNGDIIGVHLDMEHGNLSFYRNGQALGIAFKSIPMNPLVPVFTLSAIGQHIQILPTFKIPIEDTIKQQV